MSAKLALEKYLRRSAGLGKKRERKDKKRSSISTERSPEKEVEKEALVWCKSKGFDISVVESKAVYSRAAGRYLRGQTEAGFSDLVGVTNDGRAVFIELKAKGKLSTLKPHQYDFLLRKIKLGAFACCIDSASLLDEVHSKWSHLIEIEPEMAKKYLEEILPKSKLTKEILDDELPW